MGNSLQESRRTFIQCAAAGVVGLGAGSTLSCADGKKETGAKGAVTLEILEPHGELAYPERHGLSAPRLTSLNGKKIAILAMFQDSMTFFDTIKSKLKKQYPSVEFIHYPYGIPNAPDITGKIAIECDGWIDGVKASETGSRHDTGARLEKRGCPGVAVVFDE